jgi:hypothetical protein
VLLRDRLQCQEHRAVGKIGPRHDVLDPVQDHGRGGVEQHLVLVGVKLTYGETAAMRLRLADRLASSKGTALYAVKKTSIPEFACTSFEIFEVKWDRRKFPQGKSLPKTRSALGALHKCGHHWRRSTRIRVLTTGRLRLCRIAGAFDAARRLR